MCILLVYTNINKEESDYSLILVSNRDEMYDRPTQNLSGWSEDSNIIGGRDLQVGCENGTWLAISPLRKKLGVLLNLPGRSKENAKSRGKLVADFMKNELSSEEYIHSLKDYMTQCNDCVFVTISLSKLNCIVQSYCNATDNLLTWKESCIGFGNSLPEEPLTKVEAGKKTLEDICKRLNKVNMKQQLIEELLELLKSEEKHLPDPVLEQRRPDAYKDLSSIYVSVPRWKYGTRTHTIIIVTKTGHGHIIEMSLQPPIDLSKPNWLTTELKFNI